MRGRPLSGEEVDRLLLKLPGVVGADAAPSWAFFVCGLWASGLRLTELLELTWDRDNRLRSQILAVRESTLRVPAHLEKGDREGLIRWPPSWSRCWNRSPSVDRADSCSASGHGGTIAPGRRLDRIDRGHREVRQVVVRTTTNGQAKSATAHDLRRPFWDRLANRVMPQRLAEIIRHEPIETTRRYYVGRKAKRTARKRSGRRSTPGSINTLSTLHRKRFVSLNVPNDATSFDEALSGSSGAGIRTPDTRIMIPLL